MSVRLFNLNSRLLRKEAVRPRLAACVMAIWAAIGGCEPARGQASEPLFDQSVLHEIRVVINSRDLALLREHYDENTPLSRRSPLGHASHPQRQRALARPWHPESDQTRAADRLHGIRDRPTVCRPQIARPEEPVAGSDDGSRGPRHGDVQPHGPAGAARIILSPLTGTPHGAALAGRASAQTSPPRPAAAPPWPWPGKRPPLGKPMW